MEHVYWTMCIVQFAHVGYYYTNVFLKKSKMWFHLLSDWTLYFVVNAQHNSRIEPQWLVCTHPYIQIIPSGVYCTFRYAFTWLNILERLITKALSVPLVHSMKFTVFCDTHTFLHFRAHVKARNCNRVEIKTSLGTFLWNVLHVIRVMYGAWKFVSAFQTKREFRSCQKI